ncbi:protein BREVIS RADIX-like isoform X2 [Lycium barbarum]|uniref:protein BREVIS RADIX-like isoform X2 n=1 Tax=Lycium barbarum TaxID=112863 RepID=UPI00293E17AD|nr:protein BREVIS RADIX-like isoform X2 [Lycium barbarum]
MLTCITCKQKIEDDGGEEGPRGRATPNTKESIKSLTAQIKDIALKVSCAYKCKSSTPTSTYRKGHRPYPDFDSISEGVPYAYQPASSSSTPAWDFTSAGNLTTPRPDPRFARGFSGAGGGVESISQSGSDVVVEDDGQKEWTAQVEPGVQITFVSLPNGGNDLKRIRFSRDMFNKWQAQRWWGENYDRIMELYNVQRFNKQALNTPGRSEDGRDSNYSRLGSAIESPMMTPATNKDWNPSNYHKPSGSTGFPKGDMSYMDASRTTTDSRDEASLSVSNASEMESEWVEQDEPGVYITIRQLVDGTRELRRVRFSREKFGEVHAKQWWEQNRERIQTQYL